MSAWPAHRCPFVRTRRPGPSIDSLAGNGGRGLDSSTGFAGAIDPGGRQAAPSEFLRRARPDDNAQIAAIWNEAVAAAGLTTDTEPRTPASQRAWLARRGEDHPVIVAVDDDDAVLAFGSLSPYRDKPAFRTTVEDSVYVKAGARGGGLGSLVLAALLRLARERGHHAVMARIVADNDASRRLHARLGFALVGIERETAFKQGRWHDVAIMQWVIHCPEGLSTRGVHSM